jgi:hypothetical protein
MKCRSPLVAFMFAAVSTLHALAPQQATPATGAAGSSSAKTNQAQTAAVDSNMLKGALLVAEFDGGLNAKKLKPGDKVKATLTQDLLMHGKILAPVDSKLVGHVTEASPKTKEHPQSRLGVVFDKLLLKHHREVRFQATVQILAPPSNRPSRVDQPSQMLPPPMTGAGGGGFGPIGSRGGPGGGGGGRQAPVASGVGSTIGSMDSINKPVTVSGTPGSVGSDKSVPASLPQTRSETTPPVSAGRGIPPGVYGIKDLFFGVDSETPGHVIISSASTVKLEGGTQVVLRVTGPASVVTDR